MSPQKIQSQQTTDVTLLQDFLCQQLYDQADRLYDTEPDDLLRYLFEQYYVFLSGSHSTVDTYRLFQAEAVRMLMLRGQTADETEYRLRSKCFCDFVQTLLTTLKNEIPALT